MEKYKNESKHRVKSSTGTGQNKQDEHAKCPTCGQLLVSSDDDGGKRRDKRSKSGGTARPKPDGVSRSQGTSDQDSIGVGTFINVAFAFSGGDYAGQARVVRVDPGGLCIAFPWSGSSKFIQITRSEVVKSD